MSSIGFRPEMDKTEDRGVSRETQNKTKSETTFFGGVARLVEMLFSPITWVINKLFGEHTKKPEPVKPLNDRVILITSPTDLSTIEQIDQIIELIENGILEFREGSEDFNVYNDLINALPQKIRKKFIAETIDKTHLESFINIKDTILINSIINLIIVFSIPEKQKIEKALKLKNKLSHAVQMKFIKKFREIVPLARSFDYTSQDLLKIFEALKE